MGVWASQPAGALHAAIHNNDMDSVVSLLHAGVSVNEPHEEQTPLQLAVQNKRVAIVHRLLTEGAKVTTSYGRPDPDLMGQATHYKLQGLCEDLARHGAACSDKTLSSLVEIDYMDTVQIFLETGRSPNVKSTNVEMPILHLAIKNQNEAMAQILCQHGADVNQQDWQGRSPVHMAVSNGDGSLLALLLEHNASVNLTDTEHVSVLHVACRKGLLEIARSLILQGTNVNIQRKGWGVDGFTALHEAVKCDHQQLVDLLCHSGADLGAEDFYMKTPLSLACEVGSVGCVESLTRCGCDATHQDSSQNTALIIAAKQKRADIVTCLLGANCAINTKDLSQRTALHHAAERGSWEIVQLLLENGARFGTGDKHGNTALQYAILSENLSCVFGLLKHGHQLPKRECKALPLIQLLSRGCSDRAVQILAILGWRPKPDGYKTLDQFLRQNMPLCSLITWLREEFSKPLTLLTLSRSQIRKVLVACTENTSIHGSLYQLNLPSELLDYLFLTDIEERYM